MNPEIIAHFEGKAVTVTQSNLRKSATGTLKASPVKDALYLVVVSPVQAEYRLRIETPTDIGQLIASEKYSGRLYFETSDDFLPATFLDNRASLGKL